MLAAARSEHIGSNEVSQIAEDEVVFVGLGKDETKFMCVVCSKHFSKRFALSHFAGSSHKLCVNKVKKWVFVSDATALRNRRQHMLKLTTALLRHQAVHVPDSVEEINLAAQKLTIPISWRGAVKRRVIGKSKRAARWSL